MQKELVNKPEIKLVGLSARTNNKSEMNPNTAKIAALAGEFWSQSIGNQILNRVNPGITLAVYTAYASDEHGDYTYFIGEEVSSFEQVPSTLHQLTIPATQYCKFTTPTGQMPGVVIQAWQQIWSLSQDSFGGNRAYQADFEVYDERAIDPQKPSLDIYIGIK